MPAEHIYAMRLLLIILICSQFCCIVLAESSGSVLGDALAVGGLTKQTACFDTLDLKVYGGDDFRLPYFDVYFCDPYRTPERVKLFREQTGRASGKVFDIVNLASSCIDAGVRRSLLGNPSDAYAKKSEENDALPNAVLALWQAAGKEPTPEYKKQLWNDASQVPVEVAKPAAMLLYAEADALKWRNLAFKQLQSKYELQKLYDHILDPGEQDYDFVREDLMNQSDLKLLVVGAEQLASAVDRACADLVKLQNVKDFRFEAETPIGLVLLDGAGSDTYSLQQACALIIDIAGEDTYYAGAATTSAACPISVLIDISGNDRYVESPELDIVQVRDFSKRKDWTTRPNTCAAVMGYAYLVDSSGDDRYRGINRCQASAAYGVAVLLDSAGNDTYDCYQSGQGNATFGIAAVSDLAGNDSYHCFTTSQGFGGVKGFGLLIDAAGNDSYTAENVLIDFPSAQDPKHNGNLSQGAGFGERADFTTGHSLAGGVGALVDLAGDDVYISDIMAQGMGYWYGIGILSDGAGNDSYTGYWYNQGSAAHFAVGILHDSDGNDVYNAPCSMVQGAGHDFSLGFLLDDAGNDSYTAAGICLGAGNANGIGIFWDKAGDDTYRPTGNFTLGRPNIGSRGSARDFDLCLGLFIDTGGNDSYPAEYPFAKNNSSWTQKSLDEKNSLPSEVGIGIDKE